MPPCKVRASRRTPTLRKMTSSTLSSQSCVDTTTTDTNATANTNTGDASQPQQLMIDNAEAMSTRAKNKTPFSSDEIQDVINSLHNLAPRDSNIDWNALEHLLRGVAHLSHKDWDVTASNSERLGGILLGRDAKRKGEEADGEGGEGFTDGLDDVGRNKKPKLDHENESSSSSSSSMDSSPMCQIFERILHEGNWDGAREHAANKHNKRKATEDKPAKPSWAVLVTGVNGIRKTTSMYQPWFSAVLSEALIFPSNGDNDNSHNEDFDLDDLPTGHNSFFRQLDHMIATLCNQHFSEKYALTGAQLDDSTEYTETPSKELIRQYSNLKASIFSRYRTLSELLGVFLLREAKKVRINAMCETSGRDVAMFHYIDRFFGSAECGTKEETSKYNKLALHFTINDLEYAKKSVDERMIREMQLGRKALATEDVLEVIYSNQGGPYGSDVLEGVQSDSDRVWNELVMRDSEGQEVGGAAVDAAKGSGVGNDWYKAEMRITAHGDKPWTIRAVRPDGTLGTEYTFGEPRVVGDD
ncbi:hypothetical protein ACHAWF_012262 [Thalassiosira exigua]